jgi:hypothetical protein
MSGLILALILGFAQAANADVIYSGLQNISLQGIQPLQTLSIHVTGGTQSWDQINLTIATLGLGGGTNDIFAGAEVALARDFGIIPRVARFNFGDPFPANPKFGSGSEILWGFGTGPADGDFYTAMALSTFGTGPNYFGWFHLRIVGSATATPMLTAVDWAYSDQEGQGIGMGEQSVPEPSSFVLLICAAVCLIVKHGLCPFRVQTPPR